MKKFLLILAAGFLLFSVTGIANALPTTIPPPWSDDFEADTLNAAVSVNWTSDSGLIVLDPLDNTNQVLTFTSNGSGGDAFSISTFSFILPLPTDRFLLEFDYLSFDQTSANGGGFAGIADSANLADHEWLFGTQNYPNTKNIPISNGAWVHASVIFTSSYPEFNLILEDYRVPAQDAFFDNIMLSVAPIPEPATLMLLGFGLLGLAGIGRKKS